MFRRILVTTAISAAALGVVPAVAQADDVRDNQSRVYCGHLHSGRAYNGSGTSTICVYWAGKLIRWAW